jgi:hypothetical protein
MIAASFVDYALFNFVSRKAGIKIPLNVEYKYAGRGKAVNEFDLYIRALLVMAIIMMLFTAWASIDSKRDRARCNYKALSSEPEIGRIHDGNYSQSDYNRINMPYAYLNGCILCRIPYFGLIAIASCCRSTYSFFSNKHKNYILVFYKY